MSCVLSPCAGALALLLGVPVAGAQTTWTTEEVDGSAAVAPVVSIAVGDLNGDGRGDPVVANPATSGLAWYERRAGLPAVRHVIAAGPFEDSRVAIADLDGDGDFDVAAFAGTQFAWFENQGGATTFVQHAVPQPFTSGGEAALDVVAGDVDGDGDQELFVRTVDLQFGSGESLHLYVLGPGGYTRLRTFYSGAELGRPALGDLDGDGDLDLAALDRRFSPAPWLENTLVPGGQLTANTFRSTGSMPFADWPLPADFDGDGDVDLILVYRSFASWSENLGGGQFGPPAVVVPPHQGVGNQFVYQGEAADLNGDGRVDLLLSIRPTNTTGAGTINRVAWYENLGGSAVGPRQDLETTPFHGASIGFGVGDLDADGDPDVVATRRNVGANAVLAHLNGTELGTPVCAGQPNSTGGGGELAITGSSVAAMDDLVLHARQLPPGVFGYFLVSAASAPPVSPPFSQGTLCLGGAIGRYVGPGQVLQATGGGTASLRVSTAAVPSPTGLAPVLAGDTRVFQLWHRDVAMAGPTSNFTSAVALTFR